MTNKLCIVTWVYGRKYQGWIPLYIYSIKKNYPEYDVKIYLDGKLSLPVKNILIRFGLYDYAEIIEEFCTDTNYLNLTDIEKRCYRWLMYDEYRWKEYDYIYIGDIDIYLTKEKIGLLEQHVKHIESTGGVYSNSIRLTRKDYLYYRDMKKVHLKRLTGLHFVKKQEYYNKVSRIQKRIIRYLLGNRCTYVDDVFFKDDERCLWLLVYLSGIMYKTPSYELSDDAFRPLHGLHFAIGRERNAYKSIFSSNDRKLQEQSVYYKLFMQEYANDEVLRNLIEEMPFYIYNIIQNTVDFCEKELKIDYREHSQLG